MKLSRSDQYYALVLLVLSVIYLVMGLQIEQGFYSDPVGPNLWVVGVAVCLIGLSILLWVNPTDFLGKYPKLAEWKSRMPFILGIFIYSHLLPWIGFFIATPLLMAFIGVLFEARKVHALISAVIMTICCYLIFSVGLDISLPTGMLWKSLKF